jgi:hypothetical protein
MTDHERITAAWRTAATELGIRVTAPYQMEATGTSITWCALVHDFGYPAGTLVLTMHDRPLHPAGYGVSLVNPELYGAYDRTTFVETLEDWGWVGAGTPPAWYTGISPWG